MNKLELGDNPVILSGQKREHQVKDMSDAVRVLLSTIGEDTNREGLLKTPERFSKALLYLTKGYSETLEGWSIVRTSGRRLRY